MIPGTKSVLTKTTLKQDLTDTSEVYQEPCGVLPLSTVGKIKEAVPGVYERGIGF